MKTPTCANCKYWGTEFVKDISEYHGPVHPHARVCQLGRAFTEEVGTIWPLQREYNEDPQAYDNYDPPLEYTHKGRAVVTLETQWCEGHEPK